MANKRNLPGGALLPLPAGTFVLFPWLSHFRASAIIVIAALIFYATSINNEYALDDGIIIHQNDHVLKGAAGIKDILTKDAYESFYRRMCATDQLAGGRYRPLSAVSFALEQELLGTYRTGLYIKAEDSNRNGILDRSKVSYLSGCGRPETNYEYNTFVDRNNDGMPQPGECPVCWDRNSNFFNDREEDLNSDGIFNEVDCQIYGATFRHFNNIWMYALACYLLYIALSRHLMRPWQDVAFLSAFIFTIHPVHSEVVANVKSRDEIFSLIFTCLTFIATFRYVETGKRKHVWRASLNLLLALLSKEYAIMLLALVPLAIYTFTVNDFTWNGLRKLRHFRSTVFIAIAFISCAAIMTYIKRSFDITAPSGAPPVRSYWMLPFLFPAVLGAAGIFRAGRFNQLMTWLCFVVLLYVGMRWNAVKLRPSVPNTEVLNNPFLFADGAERFCTKGFILLKYLLLLVWPKTLSSDYSYDTIAFRNFASPDFWLSVTVHLAIVVCGVVFVLRRHLLGFAIWTYVLFLLMIGNVLMDIGATMGERLIFHASIGFSVAAAYIIVKAAQRFGRTIRIQAISVTALLLVVSVLFCRKTWERNFDWKNDITLFLKDVQTNPHSVLCLGNAGARYVDLLSTEDFSVTTPAGYDTAFNDQNGTLAHIERDVRAGRFSSLREAGIHYGIEVLNRAIALHPNYTNGLLNRGLLHMQLGNDFEALYNFKNVERIYPNNPYLVNYYRAYEMNLHNRAVLASQRGRWDSAAVAWNLLTIMQPRHADAWHNLGGAYFNQQRFSLAKKSWLRALEIQPGRTDTRQLLKMLPVQ